MSAAAPIGEYARLVAEREIILANAPASARRRILGIRRVFLPIKSHIITIDLRRPQERMIETTDLVFDAPSVPALSPFRPQVSRAEMPHACWRILDAVASAWEVTVDDLRGKRRHRRFAYPRFAAMAIIRDCLPWSTPQIGKVFGGRDHTTAIIAIRRAKALVETDELYRQRYHAALDALKEEAAGSAR